MLLLIGMPMRTRAQHGLSATIQQLAGKKIELSSYTGLDLVVVDSILGDAAGRFVYDPILPQGMYVIAYNNLVLEFLSTGKPVEMTLDDIDDEYSVRFVDDPDNTHWTAYQLLRDHYRYGHREPETFKRLTDSLMGTSTGFATKLILVDRDQTPQPSHFMDTDLIPTNVLSTKIVECLTRSENDFVKGSQQVLQMAKVSMPMYEYALSYLLLGFSKLGLEEVTNYLLSFPCLAEGEISAEEGKHLETITEPYQKVKVGAKAPDIQTNTIDGKPYHLYDSDAKWIIVVFWAVDCEYCHDFLKGIRKNLDLRHEFELVSFAIADDEAEVRSELRRLKLKGWHCYDEQRWEGEAFLDYHVVSTPTVFLLDHDKTIVCKPYDWDELKLYLKNNKNK